MPASDLFANNLLNRWLRNTAYPSKPTTIFFGLLTSAPTSSVGTGAVEVSSSGTGYSRVGIAVNNNTNFVVGTGAGGNGIDTNRITNAVEIVWNRSLAAWGTVTHVAIFSAVTGGTPLFWFEVPGGAVSITSAVRFRFEANRLDIGFDSANIGDTLALAWLNHFFRNENWALTGNVWVALATATTSSSITEIGSSGGYTRGGGASNTAATADDGFAVSTIFSPAVNGASFNATNLCMPTSTGAWESGNFIPRFALMTALTGGSVLVHGAISSPGAVVSTSGIGLTFASGSGNGLTIQLNN